MALSLCARPLCLRQDWWPHPSSGRHNTGNVPLAPLPKPQPADGGEQKACMAHHISAVPSAFSPTLPGLLLLPPALLLSRECLYHSQIDKRPCSKYPKCWINMATLKGEPFSVIQSSHQTLSSPSSSNVREMKSIQVPTNPSNRMVTIATLQR